MTASRIRYHRDPDPGKPPLDIDEGVRQRMRSRLAFLYGEAAADDPMAELERILQLHDAHKPAELAESETRPVATDRFTERDIVLIGYGDAIVSEDGKTIRALDAFVHGCGLDAVNTIHILPFFPSSSDRGFAVVDFTAVDPKMGSWQDVLDLGHTYDLMFDGVFNHASSELELFGGYLRGDPAYAEFFIAYESPAELTPDQRSKIFRPRTSDILTRFETSHGPRYLWTTFSNDQVDLNFHNPRVLLWLLETMLFYVRRGADIIRLDAVAYFWSEPGTESIHLPQTHAIIKLLRDVLDTVAPRVALVTETNVPHEQNVSYFGNGTDEAHMVYNFALPPLVLHTMYSGDASTISAWASDLEAPSDGATFFNVLDTHDGIGVQGVIGILQPAQIKALVETAREHGAYIGYKSTASGEEPYELNTTWWSALNQADEEEVDLKVKRYMASRSIQLALKGVPGIYTHGAIGLDNDHELVSKTRVKRDVNRGSIDPRTYRDEIKRHGSRQRLLRAAQSQLTGIRSRARAFDPGGTQRVLTPSTAVFALLRVSPEGDGRRVLAMTNVTDRTVRVDIPLTDLGVPSPTWDDLISGESYAAGHEALSVELDAYQVVWLTPGSERSSA